MTNDQLKSLFPNASADFLAKNGNAPSPQTKIPEAPVRLGVKWPASDQTPAKAQGKRLRQHAGKKGESESQIQQAIIKWWSLECLSRKLPEKVLMAFPLQGRRSAANGSRMKAEGMRAGTPDMFLAVSRGKYHGLWIELKRPKGKLASTQREMLGLLDRQCYAAFASYGFEQATSLIMKYLNGEEFF